MYTAKAQQELNLINQSNKGMCICSLYVHICDIRKNRLSFKQKSKLSMIEVIKEK